MTNEDHDKRVEQRAAETTPKRGEELSHDNAPIPRAMSTKRFSLFAAVAFALILIGAILGSPLRGAMNKLWSGMAGAPAADSPGGVHYYTCGMHPWVIQPHPGDCPICGMKLVPLDPAKFSGEVTISPEVSQNIGVRLEKVAQGSEGGSIRTVGTLTYDETRLVDVNLKVSGWIEKLYANFQGKPVKRGQKLFDLYSPELHSAEEEYLLAYRASQQTAAGEGRSVRGMRNSLLEAARTKLALFDISKGQIAEIEARGAPSRTMAILSPQSGVVVEKHAFEGMKVTPGMTAYRIADLSHVWLVATVYEYQSQQIKVGQEATVTLSYLPGETLTAKVVYIYPYLDERTRQINVRLDLPNPKLALKPGMYATVTFQGTQTASRVLVSRSAVIDTGERQVAFVSLGQGRFEPRTVQMGAESGDGKVQILDGLKPGELVVVSGQFLIDSEARMREALARMMEGTTVSEATASPPESAHAPAPPVVLPKVAEAALSAVLDGYLAIGKGLADDTDRDIGVSARKVAEAIDALVGMTIPEAPHFWHQHAEAQAVKQKASALAAAPNLDEARRLFAALSKELAGLLRATGVPESHGEKLEIAHCPMYPEGDAEGSVWIQPAGPIRNPYFGKVMLTCSDRQSPLAGTK